jgi:hypothetical protein
MLSKPPVVRKGHQWANLVKELVAFIDDRNDELHDCWNLADEDGFRTEAFQLQRAYACLEALEEYEVVFEDDVKVEDYKA